MVQGTGETVMFWVDLSKASLINNTFTLGSPTTIIDYVPVDPYLPAAWLGGPNHIYVTSRNSLNYYNIAGVTQIVSGTMSSTLSITVRQAYAIDQKIDDGLPQLGNVTAQYESALVFGNYPGYGYAGATDTSATTGSATTCYDNGGVAGTQKYSVQQNAGQGVNCALSIRFQ